MKESQVSPYARMVRILYCVSYSSNVCQSIFAIYSYPAMELITQDALFFNPQHKAVEKG